MLTQEVAKVLSPGRHPGEEKSFRPLRNGRTIISQKKGKRSCLVLSPSGKAQQLKQPQRRQLVTELLQLDTSVCWFLSKGAM